jgi:hypothetical protein
MAADASRKAINICRDVTTLSDLIMQSLYALNDLEQERSTAGITLSNYDTAITGGDDTKQATGADYQAALTSAGTLRTWLDANFHSTNLNRVRP